MDVQEQGPRLSCLAGLSTQQRLDNAGKVLAFSESGELLAAAATESELCELMKVHAEEYWTLHPGIPATETLSMPRIHAEIDVEIDHEQS